MGLAQERMTRRPSRPAERATDREVGVVAAVLAAGSEKAAAHRLGLSHSTVKHHLANARSKVGAETTAQLVWILAPRLPEPERTAQADACATATQRQMDALAAYVAAGGIRPGRRRACAHPAEHGEAAPCRPSCAVRV